MMTLQQLKQGIFDAESAPNCDVYHLFAHCVTQAIKLTGFTRHGVAERMNQALQVHEIEVDQNKLNKWFAPSQPQHMPIHYLPALCWAIKTEEPANVLLKPLLFSAVDQRAKMLQQHGQLQIEIEQRNQLQQEITQTLMGGISN